MIKLSGITLSLALAYLPCIAGAQSLTGIKTIGAGGNYANLAAAISSLDSNGVGPGGVTFNIPAGYTETIANVLSVTATGTATSPIIFQKSGTGVNPKIIAYPNGAGTPSTISQDGIWRFIGSDYVTVDGIDLAENAANTSNPATMEYGYGFYKAGAVNGCQNNTIKNCVVTLNRINNAAGIAPMVDGSVGIMTMNATAGAATTALSITAVSGINARNSFYNNTIQNCNIGIALIGYADSYPYLYVDTLNDVGGASALTGNTIVNYGGGGSASGAAGVMISAQYGVNVSYNTINNNNGGGINHAAALRGIYFNAVASSSPTITHNTVSIKGGGTTDPVSAIENRAASNTTGQIVNISNNIISGCSYTTATSGTFYGIYNTSGAPIVTISNNTFINNSTAATSGLYYQLYNAGSSGSGGLTISGNTYDSTFFTADSTSLKNYGIYNLSSGASISNNQFQRYFYTGTIGGSGDFGYIYTNSGLANIQNNLFGSSTLKNTGMITLINFNSTNSVNIKGNQTTGNITRIGTSGIMAGIYNGYTASGPGTADVSGNTLSNMSNGNSVSNVYMIYWSANTTLNIYNNIVTNIAAPAGTGIFYGIYHHYYTDGIVSIYGNSITNLTYAGTLYGLYYDGNKATGGSIYNNSFKNLTTAGAINTGIFLFETGDTSTDTFSVYNNRISGLTSTHANANGVCGININSQYGGNIFVYNNQIADLNAQASGHQTAIAGINVSRALAGLTAFLYNNTIYLGGTSSGTGFGSSGVAANTGAWVWLRNNIIINNIVPTGSGKAVALRRSSTSLNNFSSYTNNNIYYVGPSPSAFRAIFYDGTNTDSTLSSYKTRLSPRDSASLTENTAFLATVDTSFYFLYPDTTVFTAAEGNGRNIAEVVTDAKGRIRAGNAGYTGTGNRPDIGAIEFAGLPGSGTVPVELIQFSGSRKSDAVCLKWITASELNNDHFVLERSADNCKFEEIARVKGKGTTALSNGYNYDDDLTNLSLQNMHCVYYRLVQVDADGTTTCSSSICIYLDQKRMNDLVITVYPNPFETELSLGIQACIAEEVSIQVNDIAGKPVTEQSVFVKPGNNTVALDQLKGFQEGIYFIRVISSQGFSIRKVSKKP